VNANAVIGQRLRARIDAAPLVVLFTPATA
jgi:hypothetical protein